MYPRGIHNPLLPTLSKNRSSLGTPRFQRPILALVPESEAAELIRHSGCGEVVDAEDAAAVAHHLEQFLQHKRAGTLQSAYQCHETTPFDRERQTAALAELLDQLVAQRAAALPPEAR